MTNTPQNQYAFDMGQKNGKYNVYLPHEYQSSEEEAEQYEAGYKAGKAEYEFDLFAEGEVSRSFNHRKPS